MTSLAAPAHQAFIGRQAIFTRALEVAAYELLYRDSLENRASFTDITQAAASTLTSALADFGLDALIGDRPAFVNLTEDLLLGRLPIPLAPERLVLEVLETVPVTPELVTALEGHRARGFTIALDDFVLDERTRPLVRLADVIKVDIRGRTREDIEVAFRQLRPLVPRLLAEKVSTRDEFELCMGLGFDLFQGYFLEQPKVVAGRRMPYQRATLVQLLSKLYEPRLDLRALERLLATDVAFTVRVLRFANSAATARGTPISTIGQAVSRLGTRQLTALVVLAVASGFDDKPGELVAQALIRAQACYLVAARTGAPSDELFTAGLLSLLDAILDQPLAELLAKLPLARSIVDALLGKDGPAARIVAAVRAQDRADLEGVIASGVPVEVVGAAWREAVAWTRTIVS